VASHFTYGEADMAWTERSEVKVEEGMLKCEADPIQANVNRRPGLFNYAAYEG
jgi:hypothetical protein